jgi:hypothetical protein
VIRFILKTHTGETYAGQWSETFFTTIDADVPELEAFLRHGKASENSLRIPSLVGAELLPFDAKGKA